MIEDNKKNLIVTLADANFIAQAKQLFSSVYHNAGWEGDYLLLACGISESDKEWFRSKGILVYDAPLLSLDPVGSKKYPPIVLSKFYLFKEYFKQWNKVFFLDADIIVRGSLDGAMRFDGFTAPAATIRMHGELIEEDSLLKKRLLKKYKLSALPFNTGVFVIDTNIIDGTTFDRLMSLYEEFGTLNVHGEEPTLNLFFYKQWNKLEMTYNSIPAHMQRFYRMDKEKLLAYVIHFVNSVKPWTADSPYLQEWSNNLKKAEDIDLSLRKEAAQISTETQMKCYLLNLRMVDLKRSWHPIILFIDRQIGQLGLFIKRKNPALYKLISLKKDE